MSPGCATEARVRQRRRAVSGDPAKLARGRVPVLWNGLLSEARGDFVALREQFRRNNPA